MTLVEFDGLLAEMIRRLRLARAAAAVFRLAAGTLLVLSAAVLAAKLLPAERSWFWTGGAVLAAALVVLGAFAAAWLGRPVSRLAAAAEVDRVAALKERASSLVAARAGSAPRTAAFAELERDAAAALAPLAREALLRAALPALPARARWLVGLGALALGALLVPARAPRGAEDLAALLADGGELVQALESGGAAGAPEGAPQSRVASKVLSILKGPPPADPEGAQRQRKDLRELAAELRKSGKPGDQAVARRIDELADQLARLAGPAAPEGAADAEPPRGDGGRAGRGAYLRSHPEYAELLARYFGPAGG